ncbi:MAG: type II toxin-antitoxin system VapC family toxin [Pseudomonadota bacterium]
MIALDTSVVVAAFASWHEGHRSALAAMARKPRIPAHVLIESFSVLTRLPAPHRSSPEIVQAFLEERFPQAPLSLPGAALRALVHAAVAARVSGGAIYDALVAETARRARAILLTRDRRAVSTYERLAVRYELIG